MILRNAKIEDLEKIYEIESTNFVDKEVIDYFVIKDYLLKTPETIFVVEENEVVVAYCISVLSDNKVLTDNLFKGCFCTSEDKGYLILLSLSIHPNYQKQGLGTILLALLKDYSVDRSYLGLSLTCHDYLVSYYEMNGFKELGISDSKFGDQVWFNMFLEVIK